jgi:dihydroorotase
MGDILFGRCGREGNTVLVIKNARFVDESIKDILIEDNRIHAVVEQYQGDGEIIDLEGKSYISSGWIDLHTHAFPKYAPYCSHPDLIGYSTGVTTVVDAGSTGANDIAEFYELSRNCKTRVFAFCNVSKIGLKRIDELADLTNLELEPIRKLYEKHPDFIVGLKARMSASVIGENGITPLKIAKSFTKQLKLPLMVHIGSEPPKIEEILAELESGDILTHCFNGKDNNIFRDQDFPLSELIRAIERGIILDIGHGTASFSFHIAKKAITAGVLFDTISTDIYMCNKENGPVYDMATTLTKFLALGYRLDKVIHAVTEKPAQILKQPLLGRIRPGNYADLTIFQLQEKPIKLVDSHGVTMEATQRVVPTAVVLGGKHIELTNNRPS